MNGPQHYAEGERVLAVAEGLDWQEGRDVHLAALCVEAANAHFAAALVAATIDSSTSIRDSAVAHDWEQVLS